MISMCLTSDMRVHRMGAYMLVHGGEGAERKLLSDMWSFHAGSQAWQQITFPTSTAPVPRHKHTMTVVNERSANPFVILYGGVQVWCVCVGGFGECGWVVGWIRRAISPRSVRPCICHHTDSHTCNPVSFSMAACRVSQR